ncbi:MAG: DUF333 domain-containing protein [Patescibacteria group bacterium]
MKLIRPMALTGVLLVTLTSQSAFASAAAIAEIPNPASQFCVDVGGTLEIRKNADKSEYGVCKFDDNRVIEEWKLYRDSAFDIKKNTKLADHLDISALYPAFHDKKLSKVNANIARYVQGFLDQITEMQAQDKKDGVTVNYGFYSTSEVYTSSGTVSAVLHTSYYTGGAHGAPGTKVLLATKNGEKISFRQYIKQDAKSLKEFAKRVNTALKAKYPDLSKESIDLGTAPKWMNFTTVAIENGKATVFFPAYTLGSYAEGEQKVTVSLDGITTMESTKK